MQLLNTPPKERYSDFTRGFIIYTDASRYGIGAVFAQVQPPPQSADSAESNGQELGESDGVEFVITCTSKHLNDRDAKWSTTEKKVIRHHSRHRQWLMSKTEPAGRLARWARKSKNLTSLLDNGQGSHIEILTLLAVLQ
ncbi:hypothetical protein OUZ56_018515 [Daphnia magna]|uniref:Reverse transcriptase RNase H-like domain-containing protein n=1 Tax=Daphnia magna TaxID=35525 RepID=A0ABQ9ZA71_9CRUS|nr:hypothetical protein OUZ56_018515 [Daphnia magna]